MGSTPTGCTECYALAMKTIFLAAVFALLPLTNVHAQNYLPMEYRSVAERLCAEEKAPLELDKQILENRVAFLEERVRTLESDLQLKEAEEILPKQEKVIRWWNPLTWF